MKTCIVCYQTFTFTTRTQKYCSQECQRLSRRVPVPQPKSCPSCNEIFQPTNKRQIFCTKVCGRKKPFFQQTECPQCGRMKSVSAARCRECYDQMRFNLAVTPRYGKNKNYNPETHRVYYLSKRYGLTSEQWDEILRAQGMCCAICRRTESGSSRSTWNVDHDHSCSLHGPKQGCLRCVRGLLCHYCNSILIGAFESGFLNSAMEYLTNPPAKRVLNASI